MSPQRNDNIHTDWVKAAWAAGVCKHVYFVEGQYLCVGAFDTGLQQSGHASKPQQTWLSKTFEPTLLKI